MNRKAFSMMELIFVIVILGILASVAVPKLIGTREDAYIAKGKNQIASIKNGINMIGSKNLLSGGCGSTGRYPKDLNNTPITTEVGKELFGSVLKDPIISSDSIGGWKATTLTEDTINNDGSFSTEIYTYKISSTRPVSFTYDSANGTFSCTVAATGDDCDKLTK